MLPTSLVLSTESMLLQEHYQVLCKLHIYYICRHVSQALKNVCARYLLQSREGS